MPGLESEKTGGPRGARYSELVAWIKSRDGAVVAFSGGVDSSLLAAAAVDALGERALAVTARSPLYARRETDGAVELARQLGVRHRIIDTCELESPGVAENPIDRCYHCKHDKFTQMLAIARAEGLACVLEGSNSDDLGDYRPGLKAVQELGIQSPLITLGWGKPEIRTAARERGIPNWDKPSTACLASRVPYGQPITAEVLARIEQAEQALIELGFGQLRVRDHGSLARIEVEPADITRLLDVSLRAQVVAALKRTGYTYAALDLLGYRTGAMNEGLERD